VSSLWAPWTSDVPFNKIRAAAYVGYAGSNLDMIGDGEEKFADEIGGMRTFDDKYDVMGIDFMRYEVKKLTLSGPKKTNNFRASIAGEACQELITRVKKITEEYDAVHNVLGIGHGDNAARFEAISEKFYCGTVRAKALFGYEPIWRMPTIGLKQLIFNVHHAMTGIEEGKKFEAIIGDKLIEDIDAKKYVRMMHAAGLEPTEATDAEIAFAFVDDPAFFDPSELDRLWRAVKPSSVILSRADRLVFVDEMKGYCIVPNDMLDELVIFMGIGYAKDVSFRAVKEIILM